MPLRPRDLHEVQALMAEGITVLGMRFLGMGGEVKPGTKYTPAGWGDDAWFDYSVPGLLKLNCFFRVNEGLYKEVRNTNWAPKTFKRVQRRRPNMPRPSTAMCCRTARRHRQA